MEKLKELINKCKCGVHISINQHKDYYESVEQHIESFGNGDESKDINPIVYDKMKETNTIILIQFYPNTPVSFYLVFHYDLEMALDEALNILK